MSSGKAIAGYRHEKPNGLFVGGIYDLAGSRTMICTGLTWGGDGLTSVDLYEPSENTVHVRPGKEIEELFLKGIIELKDVKRKR